MTGRHVPPSDTGADEPFPGWDQLLDGRRLPETEDEMSVAHVVDALQAPGTPEELRDADAVVATLLAAVGAAPRADVVVTLAPRRPARTGLVVGSVVAFSVVFAGTAAAAANGSLPAPLQRVAAALVGAPAPSVDQQDQPTTTPSGWTADPSGPSSSPSAPPVARPSNAPSGPSAPAPSGETPAGSTPGSSHRATPGTPPGQAVRPTVPPGQTVRPSTPPGQSGRPTSPPGQGNRPTTPPGQSGKPGTPHP